MANFCPALKSSICPAIRPACSALCCTARAAPISCPQDAAYVSANYERPPILPRSPFDRALYAASIQKLHQIQEKYDATIIFPHDVQQVCLSAQSAGVL